MVINIVNNHSHILGVSLTPLILIAPIVGTPVILVDLLQQVLSLPVGSLVLTSYSGTLFPPYLLPKQDMHYCLRVCFIFYPLCPHLFPKVPYRLLPLTAGQSPDHQGSMSVRHTPRHPSIQPKPRGAALPLGQSHLQPQLGFDSVPVWPVACPWCDPNKGAVTSTLGKCWQSERCFVLLIRLQAFSDVNTLYTRHMSQQAMASAVPQTHLTLFPGTVALCVSVPWNNLLHHHSGSAHGEALPHPACGQRLAPPEAFAVDSTSTPTSRLPPPHIVPISTRRNLTLREVSFHALTSGPKPCQLIG